jgi:hypothetical protein
MSASGIGDTYHIFLKFNYTIIIIGIILTVIFIAILFTHSDSVPLSEFYILSLLGYILGYSVFPQFIGVPSSFTCHSRIWTEVLTWSLILVPIICKNLYVDIMYNRSYTRPQTTKKTIYGIYFALIAINPVNF